MSAPSLIRTRRSRLGYLFDVLLTVLGWVFFVVLFATGVLNMLRGELHGPLEAMASPPLFISTSRTLMIYAALALFNALVLIGWALYNYRRFSGKQRRQQTRPLPAQHLQSSFNLSQALFDRARDAQMMVIAHEEDSTISKIAPVPLNAMPAPASEPQRTLAEEAEHTPAPVTPPRERPHHSLPIPPQVQQDALPHWNWQPQPLRMMLYNNLGSVPVSAIPAH